MHVPWEHAGSPVDSRGRKWTAATVVMDTAGQQAIWPSGPFPPFPKGVISPLLISILIRKFLQTMPGPSQALPPGSLALSWRQVWHF